MNVNELITKYTRCLIIQEDEIKECEPVSFGEGYAKGKRRAYKRALQDLEQLSTIEYSRKVKVPQFIINTMNGYDNLHDMLAEEYFNNSAEEINSDEIQCWIGENFDKLCRAWLDNDYEVEEETKYFIRCKDGYLSFVACSYHSASEIETSLKHNEAISFTFKPQAEHMALLVGGTVEEARNE